MILAIALHNSKQYETCCLWLTSHECCFEILKNLTVLKVWLIDETVREKEKKELDKERETSFVFRQKRRREGICNVCQFSMCYLALISFSFFSFYIFISLAPFLLIPYSGLILSDCKNCAIKENHNLWVLQRTWKINIKAYLFGRVHVKFLCPNFNKNCILSRNIVSLLKAYSIACIQLNELILIWANSKQYVFKG